jgi:fructokinase
VIAVAGEVLIDLVVMPGGQVHARLGGGPYNSARALARLGVETMFLGRVGAEAFGQLLREQLAREGVTFGVAEPSRKPTTLSVATLGHSGAAAYSFYLEGTAATDLEYDVLAKALPGDVAALLVGGLGLVTEPSGSSIERLVLETAPADAIVVLDPNCRPGVIDDPAAYRDRISAVARRADIVKASAEDFAYLYPSLSVEAAANRLLRGGSSLILATDGPGTVRAFMPDAMLQEEVPNVKVVDTIGAGDAFGGGFLAWWTSNGLGRADLRPPDAVRDGLRQMDLRRANERLDNVRRAVKAAVAAASLTCTRPGADPPNLSELRTRGWWPS